MASPSTPSNLSNSSSKPLITSFTPVNKAWIIPQKATQEQKEEFKAQDKKLRSAKLASLEALILVIHHLIERKSTKYPTAKPTLTQVWTAINELRGGSGEAELTEDWELGYLLWHLLDGTGKRFLHSFHTFVTIKGKHSGHTTYLTLEPLDNPYPRASLASRFPTDIPDLYQLGEREGGIDEFVQLVMAGSAAGSNAGSAAESHASARASGTERKAKAKAVQVQDPTTRWTKGKPKTKKYYWDETTIPDHDLNKNDRSHDSLFPPDGMDLSSAWAVAIIKSNLTGVERHTKWPLVFNVKSLNPAYFMKGKAAKSYNVKQAQWTYDIGFANWQFHGDEGRDAKLAQTLLTPIGGSITSNHKIHAGAVCVVQSDNYTPPQPGTGSQKRNAPIEVESDSEPTPEPVNEPQQKKQKKAKEDKSPPSKHEEEKPVEKDAKEEKQKEVKGKDRKIEGSKPDYLYNYNDEEEREEKRDENENEEGKLAPEPTTDNVVDEQRKLLNQAQGKVVAMARALEGVHRVTTPLLIRLEEGTKLMKSAAVDLDKKTPAELKKLKDEILEYTKGSIQKVRQITQPMEDACFELDRTFPAMAQRVFIHDVATHDLTEHMKNWVDEEPDKYEKLFEEEDVPVDYTGNAS